MAKDEDYVYAERELAQLFQANGIRFCRESQMTSKIVKDLYINHLNNLIGEIDNRYKTTRVKTQ